MYDKNDTLLPYIAVALLYFIEPLCVKRVSVSGICPDNETPVLGLDIRKNTGLALTFRITRPLRFRIEFVRLTKHKIRGLVCRNSGERDPTVVHKDAGSCQHSVIVINCTKAQNYPNKQLPYLNIRINCVSARSLVQIGFKISAFRVLLMQSLLIIKNLLSRKGSQSLS